LSSGGEAREVLKFIFLLAVLILCIVGGFQVLKLYLGTPAPFRVVSTAPSSMEPTLYYGDMAVIQHVPWYEIGIGDIIVFDAYSWYFYAHEAPPPVPVIHRVVGVTVMDGQICYYTWGDNRVTNPQPDPAPTPYWLVHGKVIFTIPKVGLLIIFFYQGGYILVILLTVLLTVALVVKGMKELEEEEDEDEYYSDFHQQDEN